MSLGNFFSRAVSWVLPIFLILLSVLYLAEISILPAEATSCGGRRGYSQIKDNPLVFLGRVVADTRRDDQRMDELRKKRGGDADDGDESKDYLGLTDFKVLVNFKGEEREAWTLSHAVGYEGVSFKKDEEYLIFSRPSPDGQIIWGQLICTWPFVKVKKAESEENLLPPHQELFAELEQYKARLDKYDEMISRFGWDSLYIDKAKLQEEYKDFYQAQITLETLLEGSRISSPNCSGIFDVQDFTSDFLTDSPEGKTRENFPEEAYQFYGRILFKAGKYEEALRPLCLGADKDEADDFYWLMQAIVMTGNSSEFSGRPLYFKGVDLNGATFAEGNFRGSVFRNAKLINAVFRDVNFQGADFSNSLIWNYEVASDGADFSGANFDGAEIRSSDDGVFRNFAFKNASFVGAEINGNFFDSDFSGADFHNATISGRFENVNFEGADFSKADFSATLYETIIFTDANFRDARIRNLETYQLIPSEPWPKAESLGPANISGADFTGATFWAMDFNAGRNKGINLSGQNLKSSGFGNGIFDDSKFVGTNLEGASFRGTSLKNADFSKANLRGADFSNRSWEITDLSGANLATANIEGANFSGARFNCKTKFPKGFEPSDFLMVNIDGECKNEKLSLNYSIETLLSPPYRHYRLLTSGGGTIFKNLEVGEVNFEGYPLSSERTTQGTIFENMDLEGANFRHTKGEARFNNVNLEGADFSYSKGEFFFALHSQMPPSNIKGIKLYCVKMRHFLEERINLEDADLTAALFTNRNQRNWDFPFNPIAHKAIYWEMDQVIQKYGPADYSGMDLRNCDLSSVDFGITNLSEAKFMGAYLYQTDFKKADLTGADFRGAQYAKSTKFPEGFDPVAEGLVFTARMGYSNLSTGEHYLGATWAPSKTQGGWRVSPNDLEFYRSKTPPDLMGLDLSYYNYIAAWLPGSNMEGSNLRFTNFKASNLMGVNFSNADLTGAILFDTLLDNADFSNAKLYGADFRWARMPGVNFSGADLTNAIFDENTVWPEGFDPKAAGAIFVSNKNQP